MALDVDRVREIAERVAASSGLEVVDVELRGGGKSRMLRVFLDKAAAGTDPLAGVTHEDCAHFSREFGTILDVEDAMPGGSYTAPASVPSLSRTATLTHLIEATVADDSGPMKATFFNQPWLVQKYPVGTGLVLHGKYEARNRFRVQGHAQTNEASAGDGAVAHDPFRW